jgi:cobalt-zinc-cadmium efflux system membrane fusion protein
VFPPDSPKLEQIRVEPVQMSEVPVGEISAPGRVELNPNRVSRVFLPVAGHITTVLVKLGDPIRKGQPLLTIQSPDADAAVSAYLQAQAAVTQAKANLAKAQADLDRARDLYEHNAIAHKEVLNAQNILAQNKAALDQAKALNEQTEQRLRGLGLTPAEFRQPVTVHAPLGGKLLDISIVAGEYRNDISTAVMTIADLSSVYISADVPESAIASIRHGGSVEVSLSAYPGRVLYGRVARVADTLDPKTRTLKVIAELPNPGEQLRPEMFGRVRYAQSFRKAVIVPSGAIVQAGGRTIVYVEQRAGQFQPRDVVVENRSGDVIPIVSGLKPGERVVVDGVMLLINQ